MATIEMKKIDLKEEIMTEMKVPIEEIMIVIMIEEKVDKTEHTTMTILEETIIEMKINMKINQEDNTIKKEKKIERKELP